MALLLHLSDLHLARNLPADVVADLKDPVLSKEALPTRLTVIRHSLEALGVWLESSGQALDGIVVTGDVTVHGLAEGFDLLPEVLACLGTACPPPERILVVPGNHDVRKGSRPSSPERYENFLRLREHGYLTSFLEGVDEATDGSSPCLTATDGSFVVLGLNSANHSQVTRDPGEEFAPLLDAARALAQSDSTIQALLSDWEKRGEADVARLDAPQLERGREILAGYGGSNEARPLRIVALHHQVQPVGATEEVKSYETLTNLGEFRNWLDENEVDVVLHGHKHAGQVSAESHTRAAGLTPARHEYLVICAPTVQAESVSYDPVGFLIQAEPTLSRAAGIELADVPASVTGGAYRSDGIRFATYALTHSPGIGVLSGRTFSAVYRDVLALRKKFGELPRPLVCHVEDGNTGAALPFGYETPPKTSDPQTWFEDVISWWQSQAHVPGIAFTHGQRQASHGPTRVDQVEAAIRALRHDRASTRAVVTLIDPSLDFTEEGPDFPSFSLAHFLIQGGRLNVIGYFRKQEMPHWWPINMGEMSRLQSVISARVGVENGAITTVTAMPLDGDSPPQVAVPFLDRIAADDRELLKLVLPLFSLPLDGEGWKHFYELWNRAMSDWLPTDVVPTDRDRFPQAGLQRLATLVDAVASSLQSSSSSIATLSAVLKGMDTANHRHATRSDKERADHRVDWANGSREFSRQALAHVEKICGH